MNRLSQPDYGEGQQFETVLREAYRFELIADETIPNTHAVVAFPGHPHPTFRR